MLARFDLAGWELGGGPALVPGGGLRGLLLAQLPGLLVLADL